MPILSKQTHSFAMFPKMAVKMKNIWAAAPQPEFAQ